MDIGKEKPMYINRKKLMGIGKEKLMYIRRKKLRDRAL
jgi:hypothetical protein